MHVLLHVLYIFLILDIHCIYIFTTSNNPLGSGGVLAEEFFILCRAMWVERFQQITPRDFKSMISHVAPYFIGTQQHDCQEFLMYFLDGLHEDLNRVCVVHVYTMEPLYNGHHWDQQTCPFNGDVLC